MTLCDTPMDVQTAVSPDSMIGTWQVAVVEGGREKRAAESLAACKVQFFLPLVSITTPRGTRKYTRDVPLFARYIFCCCESDADAYNVRRADRYVQVITVSDQRKFVQEISDVHRAVTAGEVEQYPHLTEGKRCRIRTGPLMGLEGTLEVVGKRNLFVLRVSILGDATAIEIEDPNSLELMD